MHSILTQAPIQTRQDTTNKHERLFPLLTAEALIRGKEYQTGEELPRVDFWNTLGSKVDKQYHQQDQHETRGEFIDALIDARYELLSKFYGISPEKRVVIRDDAEEVMTIVDAKVESLIARGIFQPYEESFTCCSDCAQVIAPAAAQVTFCPNCKGEELHYGRKRGLFMVMSPQVKEWIVGQTQLYPESSNHLLKSAVNNMPLMIQVSKQREFGLRLEKYGVDSDFILDPKIALAMMASIIQERGIGTLDTVILGRDSIPNFIPYSLVIDQNSNTRFLTLGLIPPYGSNEITAYTSSFYYPYLALLMMDSRGNLTHEQQKAFRSEHEKLSRKLSSCMAIMDELEKRNSEINPFTGTEKLNEVGQLINEYRIRDATLALREIIYDDISKSYIEECKMKGLRPDPDIIKRINSLFNILYGNNE